MDIKSLADPFIDLANSMAAKDEEPEIVGEGMTWGTARYMAFVITRLESMTKEPRSSLVVAVTNGFREALEHHLVQMPSPILDQGEADARAEETPVEADPSQEEMLIKLDPIMRSITNMDVVLVSYLRGRGDADLADRLALRISELNEDPEWDIHHARRIYEAMVEGILSEPLAISVIVSTLTPRIQALSGEGYVRDRVLSDEARKLHSSFYSQHQLHRLATMVRKDPVRMGALHDEGQEMLLGPRAAAARKVFYDARARRAH
jgi:hypothetical protein